MQPDNLDKLNDEPKRPPFVIRRIGCLSLCVALFVGLTLFFLFSSQSKDSFKQVTESAVAKNEAAGIPSSLPAFQTAYPSTERGRAGVNEAARINSMLYYDYNRVTTSPATRDMRVLPFDGLALAREYTGNNTSITTASLLAFYDANSTPMQALEHIHEICRYEELGWTYHSFAEPPILNKQFLRLRECTRVLLPAAVWLAVQDGDTTRAYTLVLNWMYINRSLSVAGTSLVDGMVTVALNGISFDVLNKLMQSNPPPSEAIALRIYQQLDPALIRRDFLRAWEAETIWYSEYLRWVAGQALAPPQPFSTMPGIEKQLKASMGDFRSAFGKMVGDLADFRRPTVYPNPLQLLLSVPAILRAKISQAICDMFEWSRKVHVIANSPDQPTAIREGNSAEAWAQEAARKNPITAIGLPAVIRASMNARALEAQASVLRAAAMMRMAELSTARTGMQMPASLEELSKRTGKPVPLDPLGAKPNQPIIYKPDVQKGTYVITHASNTSGGYGKEPLEFHCTWSPAAQ